MTKIIVCDLDDCLIKTDLLYEQWLVLLKKHPLSWVLSFFWLLHGKSYFKYRLSLQCPIAAETLPYRKGVLEYLRDKKNQTGARLILATASPQLWANSIASHLGFFDDVISSSADKNLRGKNKLAAIQEMIGSEKFCYIGDAVVDLAIWNDAAEIVAINASPSLQKNIESLKKPTTHIQDQKKSLSRMIVKQLRVHQWIKNLLVFLPALAGHKLYSWETAFNGVFAFIGFSFCASFVYVLNDLLDLHADRNHHSKKNRPFASGDLPVQYGLFLLPLLLFIVVAVSMTLPSSYLGWIFTYLALNIAYSFYLKQSIVVDIIALSMMYTLRIFAGSAATDVPISEWLLSFSTLFFFSLACVKRYTEIIRSKNKLTLDGRGYRQVDGSMIQSLGVGTGLLSVLIILLYLQSTDVQKLYQQPQNLWFATPILLFWISRVWILTNRDEIHDDPVVFAVKDKVSWVCLALIAVVLGISS